MEMQSEAREEFEIGEQPTLTLKEKVFQRRKESEMGKSVYIAAIMILLGISGVAFLLYKATSPIQEEPELGKEVNLFPDIFTKSDLLKKLKEEDDYILLNENKLNNNGNKLVIELGSTLNAYFLNKVRGYKMYNVFKTKATSQDYISKNKEQFKFKEDLEKFFSTKAVTISHSCSKYSLIPMYNFLKGAKKNLNIHSSTDELENAANEIIKNGIEGKDKIAKKVLEFYAEILGNIIGNLSLESVSNGGVYIIGDAAKTLLPVLKDEKFLKSFLERDAEIDFMKSVPIMVLLNKNVKFDESVDILVAQ